MTISVATDGFRLAYDRHPGAAGAVVLLHGWPGDRHDYRSVVQLLPSADVVVPDLRGFGGSDKHPVEAADAYSAAAQARSVIALIEELGLIRPVLAGYDIGSRTAQAVATSRPDLLGGLVISPPLPGIGDRVLTASAQREFWYQTFHRLPLADALIDGDPVAVRRYLAHFWNHWSGPNHVVDTVDLDRLVDIYSAPGAFSASIAWYRAGAGAVAVSLQEKAPPQGERIAVPTTVLWPEFDPLFPREWSDGVEDFFADIRIRHAADVGHFTPLEAPEVFAALINDALTAARGSQAHRS
jgi:pimeloyl-ACP methyl ester carboxylesterase